MDFAYPSISAGEVLEKYPIHFHVWTNNSQKLEEVLSSRLFDENAVDPRGRTPLLLAITLGFHDAIKTLLHHGCDASSMDKQGWTATNEAVATGDPDLVSLIIQHREFQKLSKKTGGVTDILEALEEADDFYVEMKWEFSSWVPLLSRVCPSDSYKIYKSGPRVRVDTTLKGFEQMNWQRGNQSFIFIGGSKSSEVYEIDHDQKCYWKETVGLRDESMTLDSLNPPPSVTMARMTNPNTAVTLDHENISFTRQKGGFLGFGGDKTESVNGYEAKVYSVSGVELVTRTRLEHLTEDDRQRLEDERKRAQSQVPSVINFFNQSEKEEPVCDSGILDHDSHNPYGLTLEEYFNPHLHIGKDIGKLRKMTSRSQKFSATVALSDTFPLNLQEQVLPVINLMANNNSHFAKLRDFITLQLPAGFPVKIEIPLFHVLNARITFQNINGSEKCPEGVVVLNQDEQTQSSEDMSSVDGESSKRTNTKCVIDRSIFEVHRKYKDYGSDLSMYRNNEEIVEEDELLQLAIQQSLLDQNASSDGTQAVDTSWNVTTSSDDDELQKAIRESLVLQGNLDSNDIAESQHVGEQPVVLNDLNEEEQLRLVMQMSEQEIELNERRRLEEEEELARIIALSLTEK